MNGPKPHPRECDAAGAGCVTPPTATVVVARLGRPPTVRRCPAALLRHTRAPWNLIAVARSDREASGTYLAGVRDAAPVPVHIVLDPGARSARAAWQAGLARARGEFVTLVGPGVVVTDAWLDQLVALPGRPRDESGRRRRRRPGTW